jgi:hypothetical protein
MGSTGAVGFSDGIRDFSSTVKTAAFVGAR